MSTHIQPIQQRELGAMQRSLQEGRGGGMMHRQLDASLFTHAFSLLLLMVLATAQDQILHFPASVVPAVAILLTLAAVALNYARAGNQEGANPLRICLVSPS